MPSVQQISVGRMGLLDDFILPVNAHTCYCRKKSSRWETFSIQNMSQFNSKSFYFARVMLLVYLVLVAYVSLTPFNFDLGRDLRPWDWLFAPTPRYIPLFDVKSNIIAYLPLGFFMVFALYTRVRKWQALLFSVVFGSLFSGTLESLQTYLPTRIPSLIDLYSNSLGMLLGALFAIPLSPGWLSGNRVEKIRAYYFGKHQGFFILLLLCLVAQIYPQNAWLGMGDWGLAAMRISPYWTIPLDNASQAILITTLAVVGIGNFALFGMRRQASVLRVIGLFFLAMFLVRALIAQFQFGQGGNFHMWNLSIMIGLLIGSLLIYLASLARKHTQWYLAILALTGQCVIVNLLPNNPYYLAQLELLPQGNLTHLNGVLGWLALMWPYLAIVFLCKSKRFHLD